MRRRDLFHTRAFRMSMGYTPLIALAVCVSLGSTCLLTRSIIKDDVDLIIGTELNSLESRYVRSGVPGIVDEINLRIDSWGRIGAVCMLASPGRCFASSPSSPARARRIRCAPRRAGSQTATGCWSAPTCRRRDATRARSGARCCGASGCRYRREEQTRTLRTTFDSVAHDLRALLHRLRTRMDALLRQPAIEPVARERGLALTGRADPAAIVAGNRQLLAQLLSNLLENALKYVPAGGWIEVSVKRLRDRAQLVVSDSGLGMAPAERLRADQPFARIGQRSGAEGAGLGLSLVSAIARPHRGWLTLESNDPGLRAVVDLPLTQALLSRSMSA